MDAAHRHHRRERRFHRPRQSLGIGYYVCDIEPPAEAAAPRATPKPAPPEWSPAGKEILHQLSRNGLWACVCMLGIVLFCLHFKRFVAIWNLAAHSWPNLD